MTPLQRAVQIAGSQSALGRKIGVSHETVRKWLTGETPLSAERAREIEAALDGQVGRVELVFPELAAADGEQRAA